MRRPMARVQTAGRGLGVRGARDALARGLVADRRRGAPAALGVGRAAAAAAGGGVADLLRAVARGIRGAAFAGVRGRVAERPVSAAVRVLEAFDAYGVGLEAMRPGSDADAPARDAAVVGERLGLGAGAREHEEESEREERKGGRHDEGLRTAAPAAPRVPKGSMQPSFRYTFHLEVESIARGKSTALP